MLETERMTPPSSKMCVMIGDRFCCVKIAGRANFNSSVDFKRLINELRARGFQCFVLDLSECVLMDSTFLGVLTGFGLQMNPQSKPETAAIELLNPSARIVELLENLGVIHLFKINQGAAPVPAGAEQVPHAPASASHQEVTQTCLEAHRTLMAVNPDNVPRFKDVAQFLAEDLKKIKAAQ
jgi:anti-sigma B factor antagonist